MENINTWHITALEPAFGMPAYGPASRLVTRAHDCAVTLIGAVATPIQAAVAARVKGDFPVPSAWSPPPC